jgi:2-dehydropantoate 2-reductase
VRYVIVGAGAVGGTVAARLADAGRAVLLVARGEHGRVIRERGLELTTPDRRIRPRIDTASSVEELRLRSDDVLVLAVKSQDTAGLLPAIARLPVDDGDGDAGDRVPLVVLQNGVENERAALRHMADVHGVSVALPATYLEPGRVRAEGTPVSGVLEIGRVPRGADRLDEAVAADLEASGFVVRVRADVMAWKRAKLLRNLGNAVDALAGAGDDPAQRAARHEIAELAAAEGAACFAAAGLAVVGPDEYGAGRDELMTVRPVDGAERRGGSTWQSLERGAGSVETDHLNGEVVRLGRELGIATPTNAELQRRMRHAIGARPGSVPIAELLSAVRRAR